jgi:Outer membrane efflux protein
LQQRPDWQASQLAHAQRLRALAPDGWAHIQAQMTAQLSGQGTRQPGGGAIWTNPPELPRNASGLAPGVEHAWHAAAGFLSLSAKLEAQTRLAWQRLHAAHEALTATSQHGLPAARKLEEEAQRRANGMLVSTWDLLAAQRNRVDAERSQVRAVRDWHLASLDWQAVLAGADPALLTVSSASPAGSTNAEGH